MKHKGCGGAFNIALVPALQFDSSPPGAIVAACQKCKRFWRFKTFKDAMEFAEDEGK